MEIESWYIQKIQLIFGQYTYISAQMATNQASQKAHEPELWEIYEEGDFIDAKDNQADWRVGYIVQKNHHTKLFKVRFDGWSSKYDEYYRFSSAKLAEFRAVIVGYTGQKKNPGIRTQWKFSIPEHQARIKAFKEFMDKPDKTAREINQFLRGHNYFYTDFLMTKTYDSFEAISLVMEYFKMNIKFVVEYLKNIDPNFTQYYRSHEIPEESHLVNPQSAMANAFYEIMDTLYIITGSYSRLSGFLNDNTALIKKYINVDFEKNVKRYYQMHIFQQFMSCDGFEVVEKLIKQKLSNSKNVIPFLFLKSLCSFYYSMGNQISYNDKAPWLRSLVQIAKDNICKLTDKDLKDLNKAHVTELLDTLRQLFANSEQEQEIDQWALETEVDFCHKMILCPYFEKKLKGVVGLIQLTERNKMHPSSSDFVKYVIKHKIFESLFAFDNAEIIKKSAQFCKALYYNDQFPAEIGFKIWEMRIGKHEAALQQIYSLISILPSRKLTETFSLDLFKEISSVPQEQWDQDYIKMIKDYSISAIGYIGIGDPVPHEYGFQILYKYTVAKKNEFSLNALSLFLDRIEKTESIEKFVQKCFLKISKNEESDIHTQILLKIIHEQYYSFKDMDPKVSDYIIQDIMRNSANQIQKIEKRFQLLSEIARLIGITVTFEEFINLWNQFKGKETDSAFYSWVLKKKDGGKHQINSRISTEIRKDIFTTIWGDRENFEDMSEKQSQIFIQFFKSTNIVEGNIKRVNIIIKTEQMENIIGVDTIWRAFETVKQQKIAQNLADLIAEIHMTPSKYNQQNRQTWVNDIVKLFAKKINEAYAQKNLDRVTRLMTLPKKMIERDEEIFVTKPSKFYMMKDYTVVDKVNKQQKTIRFNVSGYCYDFKKIVSEKFKIPFKRCKISCKGEIIKYENYFRTMNECNFHNSPFQVQATPPEVSSVKQALNCQLQLFFNLLGNRQLQRTVWEVMSKLPIAAEFVTKISNSTKPWEDINNESIYKELYMMRVMGYMNEKWWALFIEGPGLENLSGKFSRICAKNKIERQYLKMLCQSILKCLGMPDQTRKTSYEDLLLSMFKSLCELYEVIIEQKLENKANSVELQITTLIFSIAQKASSQINPLNLLLSSFNKLQSLLSMGLIKVDNFFLRKEFAIKLLGLTEKLPNESTLSYLNIVLGAIFRMANEYGQPEKTKQYFNYASAVIGKCQSQVFKEYLSKTDSDILGIVRDNLEVAAPEKTIETVNYKLLGNLILMKQLVKYSSAEFKVRIADFVLYKCFFSHLENVGGDFKCKTKDSRGQALELLKSIVEDGDKIDSTIDFLSKQHKGALWRSRKFDDWTLTPGDKIKSASGYVGLKNLGCTCYMNSFFQQLFMIPDFRKAILQCDDPLYGQQKDNENVLFQVKKMFYNLIHSERKFYSPVDFCFAFKNYEGQPTNVHEQMDIDEFSGMLFDRLENQMKGTRFENVVKDFFGGVFSNQIICKGCPHFSETEESFLSISLSVKNKKNIYQSLDTMIKGDTLEGDNAYFCERCNKKVAAVKRVCLKKLPDHLFLTLKRFQFDFETMNKMKINDYCEFPTELNVKEYSQQYLRKQENPDKFDEEDALPDSYYDYVLKGVAIHVGYADSGHYYSFIKERQGDGKWYEFNDTTVRGFDVRKLAEEAFGGEIGTYEIKEKIKNAYMLLYERKKKIKDHSDLAATEDDLSNNKMYSELSQQIYQENVIQKIENILFSDEYLIFITNLIKSTKKMTRQNAIMILKYAVQVYLTVTIRQKEEAVSFQFLKKLQPTLVDYPEVYEWILKIFSAQSSLMEFFKNNPAREIKKLLAGWLVQICKLSHEDKQNKFIDALTFNIYKNTENVPEFCSILFQLMKNERMCDYAVSRRVPGIMMDNVTRKVIDRMKQTKELDELGESNIEDVEEEIGKEIYIQKTPYELAKKPRPNNEVPHLWGVMCIAIKRCKTLGVDLQKYLQKTTLDDLTLPSQKIYKILQEARGKFMINKFSEFLCYLSQRNQAFGEQLMFLIYRGLREFESKRYRQFFTLMKNILKINDVQTEKRTKNGLNFMIKALKDNEKYTLDSNIIQQWIMKLTKKNKNLQKVLRQQSQNLKYLLQLSTKKVPTEDICRKNCYFLENSVNKYHGIKMMKTKKGYLDLAKKIQKFYEDVGKNQDINVDGWESDEDLTEADPQPGQNICFFDQKENIDFIEVKVQEVLFGRIWFSVDKTKVVPIWKDDERLTASTYTYEAEQQSEDIACSENTTEMDGEDDLLVDP